MGVRRNEACAEASEEDKPTCLTDCLADAGLSDDCGACLTALSFCAEDNCLFACSGSEEMCDACIDTACEEEKALCAGAPEDG